MDTTEPSVTANIPIRAGEEAIETKLITAIMQRSILFVSDSKTAMPRMNTAHVNIGRSLLCESTSGNITPESAKISTLIIDSNADEDGAEAFSTPLFFLFISFKLRCSKFLKIR